MESRREPSTRLRIACILVVVIVAAGGIGAQIAGNLPPSDYELVSGSTDVFPFFGARSDAFVIDVPPETSQGMMLALFSLQGLVNRDGAQIFLNTTGTGNTSFLLPFIRGRYPVNFSAIPPAEFLHDFASFASGLVVYDSSRPDTITVATVMAGLENCIMVDPSIEQEVSGLTGLSMAYDLRQPPWSGLSALQLQRKSFAEFYPRTSKNILGIIAPDKTGLRDYLIASRVWTFYAGQGPFASQEEIDFTKDVLASTPHNIPVLGWFETPNLVEENFFVQTASREGKFILGGHNVPNLSFLSGLSPPAPFSQKRVVPPAPPLADDGIYVSFAVPDGDNLDFDTAKMLEVWQDDVRGTVPIAWSISPLLAQLAPPILDYYYSDATALDSFVAGPSGAGYLYPGFEPQSDLEQYLVRTRRAMAAADMDTVWLLNAFRAYEIPYREETLEAYVSVLSPRGIILDYADQAVTRDVWMQGGEGSAAPIIRSTHLWSGEDNLVGKVMVDIDAAPSKPHFFFVVVYPWTLQLGEAVKALDALHARYGDRVKTVSVENLLSLVTGSFVRDAAETIDQARANPFSLLDPWDMDSASQLLDQAERDEAHGDTSLSGFHAYTALQHARRAVAVGAIAVLIVLIAAFFGAIILFSRFGRKAISSLPPRTLDWLPPATASVFLFYLFFAGLQRALDYNFWTYASVFVAGVALLFASRLQSRLASILGGYLWIAELGILAVSGLFLLYEPWAFVPFACANAMLLLRFLGFKGMGREKDAILLGLGVAGSVLVRFDAMSLALSVTILVGLGYLLNPQAPTVETVKAKERTPDVTFAATVLAMTIIWLALFQNRYFFEKAGGGLDLPIGLAVLALVAAPIIALVAWGALKQNRRVDALVALTGSTVLWIALWFGQDATVFAILVMAIAITVCWSHLSAVSRVRWSGGALTKFVPRLLILGTIVVVLVRMPAIVYSLYVMKFPLPVEYVLYTPALLMIFATLDIVQTEALVRAVKRTPKKRIEENS
jgi:hypothetical protein